jgi:threonine dehydratase
VADIERSAAAGGNVVRRTPILSSRTLSERCGATVALKTENLQRTGSFKLRGALSKIASLGEECAGGVVCGSAGNHGQAVAYAARARGVACEVFMPTAAPIAKVEAVSALGALVRLVGADVRESLDAARARAAEASMAFVHPFADPEVIAGQGGIGLELLSQVPDMARVLVPVGGGGLISGVSIALRSARPDVEVIGVRVHADARLTIADGIAIKEPGEEMRRMVDRWADELVIVDEDEVGEAMVFLLERAKLVVEGAGAVGVAALIGGRLSPATREGSTVVILSGGNVDPGLLAEVVRRHETQAGRRLVLLARLPDRPGSLAPLLALVAEQGANLLDVQHIREGIDLHVRESAIQLVLETRGAAHAEEVRAAVRAAGYAEPPLRR